MKVIYGLSAATLLGAMATGVLAQATARALLKALNR